MTGTTSMIIHSGLLRSEGIPPDARIASITLSRFSTIFLRCWLVSSATCMRSASARRSSPWPSLFWLPPPVASTSSWLSSVRTAVAPMSAAKSASPSSFALVVSS
jgi:hypothetical protein